MGPFDLAGRVALVTGAGRGIGREVARTLAGAGAAVSALDLDPLTAREAADEVAALGPPALAVQADVTDPASVARAVEATIAALGRIDVLVNVAGICRNAPAESMSDADWRDVMAVNLDGVFWCCRAVAGHMLGRGSGAIVNIASLSASVVDYPQPQVSYNASKAGVVQLTRSLASEWADRGVRVNCVSPGYIATEMTKLGMASGWGETWLSLIPMGRLGEPSEVAYAVLYLASDAAAYTTGTEIELDGGFRLR
jgi:NAD(P)-dependent dehydrogenase (short-subunit alcohol dehydrogenase family)